MARVKITEYKAKQLVYKHLGFSSNLISLDANNSLKLNKNGRLVPTQLKDYKNNKLFKNLGNFGS